MQGWLVLAAALLLGGCVPNNVRQDDAALFDFGEAAAPWNAPALRGVDVVAPSWLGTPAMQYRLGYAEAARRRAYVESRWAAPPAELIEQALRRRALAPATAAGVGDDGALGCRLRIDVDEFVQAFDTAQSSRVVLALRASLVSRNEQPVASRAFALERPAASADAHGGVVAAAAVVQGLTGEVAAWIAGEKSALATRCQN
jgi:cholesterol transport system auxiliary component